MNSPRVRRAIALVLGLAWCAIAAPSLAGPPPVRNPAGMRNPAGPSPRNPAGPPPTDPTGSFSHLRPIRPPGTSPSRPGGGWGGGHGGHGHHGNWNGAGWGYPWYNPGVVVIGPTWNGFPRGSNFYCQVHGIGFAFQDMFLEHVAYVDGVAPDYAMTLMYDSGGVWVFPGAW